MAYVLEVHIVDAGDNTIKVSHMFWGLTVAEVREYFREHLASCEYFRAAHKEGRVIQELEEIDDDELPDADLDEFEETEEAG
jgi:hypothetical protein